MIRVFVDFNTMQIDPHERVTINMAVADNQNLATSLKPGSHVMLCDTDLEVEAVVEFHEQHQLWLACPIWATQRDLPYP